MKLSDYIETLQYLLEKYGDLDCVVWKENDDWDSTEEGWYVTASKSEIENKVFNQVSTYCTYITNQDEKVFCSTNLIGYIDCTKEKVFVVEY